MSSPQDILGAPRPPSNGGAGVFMAWPLVDTLYDYLPLLGPEPIARFPEGAPPPGSVAIIGAGPAGMVAAYELLRAGIVPCVFEATNRIGGRNCTRCFTDGGQPVNVIAEMGAMRVPVSNKVFWSYANRFQMKASLFPDPGRVPTTLSYKNTPHEWAPGSPPPEPFARIQTELGRFVDPLVEKIWEPWRRRDWEGVRGVWQGYVNQYANLSFYEALKAGIPQWKADDFVAFGALGIGSGGFAPLYEINFLEMLRILVNQWENDQQMLLEGVGRFIEQFHTQQVTMPDGKRASLQERNAVSLNTPVTGLESGVNRKPKLSYRNPATGEMVTREFSAIIVATTTRSMQITLGLTQPAAAIASADVKNALRELHMIQSSKMFIRTRTKFWLDAAGNPIPGMPQNIQTDELPRGVYCLDYPQTENGVVLVSYTWGDDSSKLLGLDIPTRFEQFKQVLRNINPQFADHLVPVGGEILNVDWEAEPYFYGAFKLHHPGQEPAARAAYHQFLSVLDPLTDTGVYLAGDGVSWSGGWTEGALHTGLNAACAAARRLGGLLPPDSPLTQNPDLYDYGS
ncbi:flavin monoamine oxidase family protein [Zavarzinella formosa]|uniref:flavin monoamine oxidase family protein n=1 Tax=Zavarzinella formosa TaxID=360055 RepID=UPI0002EFB0B6|nr:NAD(P)/FAD-dependent oxidoreductase [Zavarzinella formosa]